MSVELLRRYRESAMKLHRGEVSTAAEPMLLRDILRMALELKRQRYADEYIVNFDNPGVPGRIEFDLDQNGPTPNSVLTPIRYKDDLEYLIDPDSKVLKGPATVRITCPVPDGPGEHKRDCAITTTREMTRREVAEFVGNQMMIHFGADLISDLVVPYLTRLDDDFYETAWED